MNTVNATGVVVRIAYRISLKTKPSVKTVNSKANNKEPHCESTTRLLTSIVTDATPINLVEVTPNPAVSCLA